MTFFAINSGTGSEIMIDADIHHPHVHAGMPRQYIHPRATAQEVQDICGVTSRG